jgi:hypothetical protein
MSNRLEAAARSDSAAALCGFETFGVLGRKSDALPPSRFAFFLVDNWPTPSFSPLLLLPGNTLCAHDLPRIEQLYATLRVANAAVTDTPYLTILKQDGVHDLRGLDASLAAADWHREPKPLLLKVFTRQPDRSLPADHVTDITDFAPGRMPAAYCDLLHAGFGSDDDYLAQVEATFAGASARTQIVLIRNRDGAVVAGGAVSVRDRMAFLTWGTVAPAWRDHGYHRYILNHCLATAVAAGARVSALTTRNDRVGGRHDSALEMYICRKRASDGRPLPAQRAR